jgi:hypothetical protein
MTRSARRGPPPRRGDGASGHSVLAALAPGTTGPPDVVRHHPCGVNPPSLLSTAPAASPSHPQGGICSGRSACENGAAFHGGCSPWEAFARRGPPAAGCSTTGGRRPHPAPVTSPGRGPTPVPDRPTTMRQPGAQPDDDQDEPPPGVGRVAIARRTVRPTSQYVGGLCCGQRGALPERGRRVPPVRARRRATPPTGCGRHGRRGMTMDRGGYVRSTAVQTGRSDVGWSSERWSGHERA